MNFNYRRVNYRDNRFGIGFYMLLFSIAYSLFRIANYLERMVPSK